MLNDNHVSVAQNCSGIWAYLVVKKRFAIAKTTKNERRLIHLWVGGQAQLIGLKK